MPGGCKARRRFTDGLPRRQDFEDDEVDKPATAHPGQRQCYAAPRRVDIPGLELEPGAACNSRE